MPRSRICSGALEGTSTWLKDEVRFKNYNTFKRCVDQIASKQGRWQEAFVRPGTKDESWAPMKLSYWKRDMLEIMKDMVGDVRLVQHMEWAPKKVYNRDGKRLYNELWTGDWWWEMQVQHTQSCY
jgi:hypothetical protein